MFNQKEYAHVKDLREIFSHGRLNVVEPDLSKAILSFSSSLENKDWKSVYNNMNTEFKDDFTYEYFMMKFSESNSIWQIKEWSVMDIEYYSDDLVRTIIKFESDVDEKYTVIWWVKEDGIWSCVVSFPFKLEFSTRYLNSVLSEFIPTQSSN